MFTFGVVSSSVFWWRYCVIVHVGISVVKIFLRLLMLVNERFLTATGTDKLLWVSVVCVVMLTSSVSCVRLSLVYDLFVRMSACCCVVLTYFIWIIGLLAHPPFFGLATVKAHPQGSHPQSPDGRPQLFDCCPYAASIFWWSSSVEINCRAFLSTSSWYSRPRLRISWLLWRYLYFNRQSSRRFWILHFQSLVRAWHDR